LFHNMACRRVLGKGSAITLFRLFGGARLEAERPNDCFYKGCKRITFSLLQYSSK
jgi:hypothetical protein